MGGKILLVDDDELILLTTGEYLTQEGFEVETAEDGASGFAMLERFSPQIIITDLKMPKMGGMELLKKVKELENRIQEIEQNKSDSVFRTKVLEFFKMKRKSKH